MTRDSLRWERLLETRPKMGCVQMQGALACAVSLSHSGERAQTPRLASARLPGPCSRGFIAPCPGSPLRSPSLRYGISCPNQSHVTCVVQ
uniref:Uncharacterized protein n=1 Tax=Gorilla gorilla gorilla TaxID=9595 RepID=A0A2I2ZNE0_GORGO